MLVILLIIAMLVAASYFTKFTNYLTFEDFKNNSAVFKDYVHANYLLAVFYFIGIYFVVAALSVPGAFVLSIAGGFLFGTMLSTAYILAGATSGAILAFLSSRYLVGNFIQKRYKHELLKANREIEENGKYYILTLRLISLPPFFILNILAGISKLDLKSFVWTTALGILPGTLIYSYAGSNLSRIEEPGQIFSFQMLFTFFLLGVISLMPVLFHKLFKRKRRHH